MNPHPTYRRRRRVVVAVVLTLAAAVFYATGPDGTDGNDPCHDTPHTPTCLLSR